MSTAGQNHASQLPDLERWVAALDGPVVWYRDTFTGRTMDRPAMLEMFDKLNAGKLQRVVVWRLDRLGRTAKGLCTLFDGIRERKVDLVSLRDGFSLDSPSGRLHARILASVAEYETEIKGERVRAGQAAAKPKGKRWGGSKPGRRLSLTDEGQQAALAMLRKGEPITTIARVLGVSRPTGYRAAAVPRPS